MLGTRSPQEQHSTRRYGEHSTFQYLNAHIRHRCGSTPVLLPSPLYLSYGQPGPRRTWRELWDAARVLIFWGIAWASAAHGERSIRNSQRCATPAGMRSTATATAAAIIQPHRAHASTWCAYIDTHQRYPHAQVYLEQTAPPIRASLMCVLLPSPLHLSWGRPGPRRTWRELWDAARVLIFWGIAWTVPCMERGQSVTVLCNTCRNAFHRYRHRRRRRHHPATPRPSQYTVCIHRGRPRNSTGDRDTERTAPSNTSTRIYVIDAGAHPCRCALRSIYPGGR